MLRIVYSLAAVCLLASCSGYEDDEPVRGVTQTEREALDDAAEMLEKRRLPDDALPSPETGDDRNQKEIAQ